MRKKKNWKQSLANNNKWWPKWYSVGISFGYYELVNDSIYSSQMTIDKYGKIINNYRRISPGWKEKIADYHYIEGTEFTSFIYLAAG